MNASTALPNPETPLAWLPPSLASQFEASRYLYMTALGAWLWDFLMSLPEEYKLVLKSRMTIAQAAYIIARISSIGFVLTSTLFQVAAIDNCSTMQKVLAWFFVVAVPSNSLLFFIRVRAVFDGNKYVVGVFFLIWLSTFGSLTVPFAIDGVHIGTTDRCINSEAKPFSSVGIVVSTVNDTLVFFAITVRLIMYNTPVATHGLFRRTKLFFTGDGMGGVSKALLQTGQLYYLATVGMNILTMTMILTPTVPAVLHAMFTVPNVALENAMACRVFRKLKLGLIREHPALSGVSHSIPSSNGRSLPASHRGGMRSGKTYGGSGVRGIELDTVQAETDSARDSLSYGGRKLAVNISQEVDVTLDGAPFEHSMKRLEGEDAV